MPKRAKRPRESSAPPSVRGGDARERILEVTERMLRDVGPDALRLQEIAREVGVSHPAILHHFKSRAGLVHAVVDRAVASLEAGIVESLSGGEAETNPTELIERVFRAFSDHGHARLIAWLSLSGVGDMHATSKLGDIARLVHSLREARHEAARLPCPPFEDTAFIVELASLALLGDAICGAQVRAATSLTEHDPTGARFRAWLAETLVALLEQPSRPPRERS
jgi:AcrR family transcriptional regulator